jgi:hypothetical protein
VGLLVSPAESQPSLIARFASKRLFTEPGTQAGQVLYTFVPKLTESAGVSATVTFVYIEFDEGWSGFCEWNTAQMVHTRLPANDTLMLDTLTCPGWFASWADVWVNLKDDNGYPTYVHFNRWLGLPESGLRER